ncbi:cytidine deaminase [Pasteurellaceae bacterium RH1A]|nr:cytidine deaminase [Pasteurellaceae bacterium RH1A]
MPDLTHIQARLAALETQNQAITQALLEQLIKQDYQAQFSADFVTQTCQQFELSAVDLALHCLPLAACYALVPVSNFYVGAVAIGQSGNFYFGANQEFAGEAMQQTVHAEQSAVGHAWLAGEKGLNHIVVNYTPCGHCRQFLNELNSASSLQIHLPHSQNNQLHSYLPDAFGPKDLNVAKVLFDPQEHHLNLTNSDPLVQAALQAANQAYAPYSQALSGLALEVGNQIITGRYAENAAFNPSFLPLQAALNYRRLQGLSDLPIKRAVMVEKQAVLSHAKMARSLLKEFGVELEYYAVE